MTSLASIAVLMRMPGNEKELAAGFAITEGYVRQATDILLIHHCGSGHPAPGEEADADGDLASRNQVTLRVLDQGFTLKKIQPVDMFPQTHHIETVVLLEKNQLPLHG